MEKFGSLIKIGIVFKKYRRIKYVKICEVFYNFSVIGINNVSASTTQYHKSENDTEYEKEIYTKIILNDRQKLSQAKVCRNVKKVETKVRDLEMIASVTLKVTIRVNESTGKITSYGSPSLVQNFAEAPGYVCRVSDITTYKPTLSSSGRTLHCKATFRIHAETSIGGGKHDSGLFTITLDAQ